MATVCLCLCFALCSGIVRAQAISGDLTGTVFDASGAAIPNATVVAFNDATGVKTDCANQCGRRIPLHQPAGRPLHADRIGDRVLHRHAEKRRFDPEQRDHRQSDAGRWNGGYDGRGERQRGLHRYHHGPVADHVRYQASTGTAADAAGSGVYNLALLGAGVSTSGGVGQGFGPAVAGQRPDNNSFFLDGVSNNNYYNPAPLVYVSNEAIAEFTLLQNQFAPEFGGGSGGIFNAVVKSGTNQIHGSIYEYLQNRNLNAVNSLSTLWPGIPQIPATTTTGWARPSADRSSRTSCSISETSSTTRSAILRCLDRRSLLPRRRATQHLPASRESARPTCRSFKNTFPRRPPTIRVRSPCRATQIPIGSISFTNPVFTNNYNALVSLDYNMSDKDQIRGRWIYNNQIVDCDGGSAGVQRQPAE